MKPLLTLIPKENNWPTNTIRSTDSFFDVLVDGKMAPFDASFTPGGRLYSIESVHVPNGQVGKLMGQANVTRKMLQEAYDLWRMRA
jgi:hypothetical protein